MFDLSTEEEKRNYYREVLSGVFSMCLNIRLLGLGCSVFNVLHSVIHDLDQFRDMIEADEVYCGNYYKLINYHNELAKRKFGTDWLETSEEKPTVLYIADGLER